jgi:hypothetical protein
VFGDFLENDDENSHSSPTWKLVKDC